MRLTTAENFHQHTVGKRFLVRRPCVGIAVPVEQALQRSIPSKFKERESLVTEDSQHRRRVERGIEVGGLEALENVLLAPEFLQWVRIRKIGNWNTAPLGPAGGGREQGQNSTTCLPSRTRMDAFAERVVSSGRIRELTVTNVRSVSRVPAYWIFATAVLMLPSPLSYWYIAATPLPPQPSVLMY